MAVLSGGPASIHSGDPLNSRMPDHEHSAHAASILKPLFIRLQQTRKRYDEWNNKGKVKSYFCQQFFSNSDAVTFVRC